MIDAIPKIRKKADVEIKEKDKKIFKMTRNFYISIGLGILIAALVGTILYKPTYEFNKLKSGDQEKVRNAVVSYKNASIQFKDLFGNDSIAYGKLTSEHITDMLDGVVLDFDDPQLYYLNEIVSFEWDGLDQKLKEKLLDTILDFQGQVVKFKTLNALASEAFEALTSNQIINILNRISFKIGQTLRISSKFYLHRKFLTEDASLLIFEYQLGHDYKAPGQPETDSFKENIIRERTKEKSFQRFCDEHFKKNSSLRSEIYNKIRKNSAFFTKNYDLSHKEFLFMVENSKNIIEKVDKEKIFVLSSEAGAGKTIAFEHLGIEIKELHQRKWVSYVDLKGRVDAFSYDNLNAKAGSSPGVQNSQHFTTNVVLKLLMNILDLSQERNNFEDKIFEESFKSGNLVLVWNGYDEIAPEYSDFVLNLISFIHNSTSNAQYLCTRPLYSDQLSQAFNTRTYQLVPLNANEKKDFLKRYFMSQGIPIIKIDQNIQKVEKIIQKLQTEDKPLQDFNTPLMLKLVAEIYIDELLMESGNIYGIYETFIKKKIRIWLKKGSTAHKTTEDLIFDSYKFNIMEIYRKYALLFEISLFTTSPLGLKLQKLHIMHKQIPKDLKFYSISEMGILYINGKNKFEFAHKTFAEFFIARYFIENIYNAQNNVQEDEAELRLELFFKLLQSYGEKQTVITDFMGSYLAMNERKMEGEFAPAISRLLRTKFREFFFRLLDTNFPIIWEFLFKFFSKDHDLLIDLLHVHQNATFYTAIFNPSYFALATNPEHIKNISKAYLSSAEYYNFTSGVNQKGMFYYGLYFYEQVDAAKSHPDHDDFIKQFMYDNYWTFFQKIQNNFEMFKSRNILHESHYFSFAFEYLWTYISNHTTKQQKIDILSQNDTDDKNLFMYSIFRDRKDAYASNCYFYYIYDFTPFKIFHRALTTRKTVTLKLTIEIYEHYFTKSEIQDVIMASNDLLYYVVDSADHEDFQSFVDYLKKVFKGSETKLKEYLERNIKPTSFPIIEYVENLMELPWAPANWQSNLEMLKQLYKTVKDSSSSTSGAELIKLVSYD